MPFITTLRQPPKLLTRAVPRLLPATIGLLGGLAAPYETWAVVDADQTRAGRSGRSEKFAQGSFSHVLDAVREKLHNVQARVNHDPKKVLGSTADGTLRLRDTPDGLAFDLDLPDNNLGKQIKSLAEHGKLRGMSAGLASPKKIIDRKPSEDTAVPIPHPAPDAKPETVLVQGKGEKRDWQVITNADLQEVSVILPGMTPSYKNTSATLLRAIDDKKIKLNLLINYYEYL